MVACGAVATAAILRRGHRRSRRSCVGPGLPSPRLPRVRVKISNPEIKSSNKIRRAPENESRAEGARVWHVRAQMATPMRGSGSPLAPEKGVFPLDHFGECKKGMKAYLSCLKRHGEEASACRQLSADYLKCRMERELMAEQPLEELGFSNKAEAVKGKNEKKAERREGPSKSEGFVGGVRYASRGARKE